MIKLSKCEEEKFKVVGKVLGMISVYITYDFNEFFDHLSFAYCLVLNNMTPKLKTENFLASSPKKNQGYRESFGGHFDISDTGRSSFRGH